jgi:D-alanine-D-alanine ligase
MNPDDPQPAETNPLVGKHFVILSSGGPKKQFIFKRLNELGCRVTLLNDEKNWAIDYVDELIAVNRADYPEVLRTIKELDRRHHIDGIGTFWNDDVLLCAKLCKEMGLIGLPYDQAKLCKNKVSFRDLCVANGIPAPKFAYIKNDDDVADIMKSFSFPVVVKPVWGDSSAFVVKVETAEELQTTVEYIRTNMVSERNQFDSTISSQEERQIFVEEYIEGEEIDLNGIIQNGRLKVHSISDNGKTEEPFFIETDFSMPSNLPEDEQDALLRQVDHLFEVLGIQNCCFQFEAKSTPTGPVPIELNLRMGGDEAYFFTKNVWGIDIIENYVKLTMGILINVEHLEEPLTYCAGQDFLCDNSGVLVELDIDEDLFKYKNLDQFVFIKKVGDAVLVPPEGFEYLGWISVTGDNMVEAKTNLSEAVDFVDFKVARFHPTSSIGKSSRKTPLSLASVERARILQTAKATKITHKDVKDLRVGVLAKNGRPGPYHGLEAPYHEAVETIQAALEKLGCSYQLIDINAVKKSIQQLQRTELDLVINACKQLDDSATTDSATTGLLDFLQLPYTGSNSHTLAVCKDKIEVKKLLHYHDIPTPAFDYVYSSSDRINPELEYPLIVKPTDTDNSVGISNESVVTTPAELKARVKYITETLGRPALIEEYIEGYEVEACILGNDNDIQVLPLTKIDFSALPKGYWHILPHEAKTGAAEEIYSKLKIEQPAVFEPQLEKLLSELAIDTFNILAAHDYATVEIRVSEAGNPYVIELTPNPFLNATGSYLRSAEAAGLSPAEVIKRLLASTQARYQQKAQ